MRNWWLDLGWLVILVVTFSVPLALDAIGKLTYMTSLLLWFIPIAYLWTAFQTITASGTGRRRRALRWTAGAIVLLGVVLDFLLGHLILRFPGCAEGADGPYWLCLPAVGGRIPVEEVLFYLFGPTAMVLVYACADERWLQRYNPPDDLIDIKLLRVSPSLVWTLIASIIALLVIWRVNGTFPIYAAFLASGALLPAMFLYRSVGALTNWPAFAVTTLYVLVTSVVWEVTLAIPRAWWGYEGAGMVGLVIDAWSRDGSIFPVEAAFVWLCAPLSIVLIYEFAKAFTHHPASSRVALLGKP